MKGVVVVINKSKRLSMRVTYQSGRQPRQVPEWAVRQALHFVFGLGAADVSLFITLRQFKANIRNGAQRTVKTWDNRSQVERIGATVTGFAWLLAQDQPLLRAKAAPVSRAVFEALGEEEWNRLCDQLGVSYHERAEMLFTPCSQTTFRLRQTKSRPRVAVPFFPIWYGDPEVHVPKNAFVSRGPHRLNFDGKWRASSGARPVSTTSISTATPSRKRRFLKKNGTGCMSATPGSTRRPGF